MHTARQGTVLSFTFDLPSYSSGRKNAKKIQPKARSKLPPRMLEMSVTIGRHNAHVEQGDIDGVKKFLDDNCASYAMGVEQGGTAFLRHMQIVMQYTSTSPAMFRIELQKCLKWAKADRVRVSAKELKGEGVHTWHGMLGYVTKDVGLEHYVLHHKNVDEAAFVEGTEVYARHGAPNKNVITLNQGNIIDKVGMFFQFKLRSPPRMTFLGTLARMLKTKKYTLAASWACTGKAGAGLDCNKTDVLWKHYSGGVLDAEDLAEVVYSPEGLKQYGEDMRLVRQCVQKTMKELIDEPGGPKRDGLMLEYRASLQADGFMPVEGSTFLLDFAKWVRARNGVAQGDEAGPSTQA